MNEHRVICSDCLGAMSWMPDASIDSIVTDPPYGLSFMGAAWDHGVPGVPFWREALRVAKPGAYLVAFGGTRTYHRLACAIEDAGWEVRDCLSWLYGSGFPKSLDVGKALDKAAGAEREIVGPGRRHGSRAFGEGAGDADFGTFAGGVPPETAPATDLARQWQGWGTALKPAWEPAIVARKPLIGTVAENVTAHGTGGINVDVCRIEGVKRTPGYANPGTQMTREGSWQVSGLSARSEVDVNEGRWPANVLLDEEAAAALDAQTGTLKSGGGDRRSAAGSVAMGAKAAGDTPRVYEPDSGGASRFFYVAKASKAERGVGNVHPTVKPLALMRWIVRLVTPPGGLVLDPFAGSGTTGLAAHAEGMSAILVEREPAYARIIAGRLEAA